MPARPPSDDSKPAAAPAPRNAMQQALAKMGLLRDIDLALHLPLRYEDETRITRLRDARESETLQIEATVTSCEISYRPRRQLLVTVDDGSDTCTLRFFSFYPSQQKMMQVGGRVRVRGEVRGGFLGWAMVHPTVHPAGGALPAGLTPVYPSVAGMPQAYLRKAVLGGLARADLGDTLGGDIALPDHAALRWPLRDALQFLHYPRPEVALATLEDHSHAAWQRLKLEELLAQQLSQLMSRRARDGLRAPMLPRAVPPRAGAPAGRIALRVDARAAPCQRRDCP